MQSGVIVVLFGVVVKINGNHKLRTTAIRSVCDPSVPIRCRCLYYTKSVSTVRTKTDYCKCTGCSVIIVQDGSASSLPNVEAVRTLICG